ncbi:hypothetical protein [Campylobacter sp.]|uniref:hypothetical protein n=1 Tax=Campylobacter sp. TaxID=205 RepID=UPI0026DC56B9|nr:hypothetical protein [Campylobacter sp.]MDO4674304.1 hypothetical protein [Campylobacter sp.]
MRSLRGSARGLGALRAGEGAVRGNFQGAKIGAGLRLGGWAEFQEGILMGKDFDPERGRKRRETR